MSGEMVAEKAVVLRCRECHKNGVEWQGMEVFAKSDGVFLHCRVCSAFVTMCKPLAISLSCDLCKEGDTNHKHEDFREQQQEASCTGKS